MPRALASPLMALAAVMASGCCALAPCHPSTALVGRVEGSNGVPIESSRVALYGVYVPTDSKGCFKAHFSDALPFTFVVAAAGYKTVEMKVEPGFYRAIVSLAPLQTSGVSQVEWLAISPSEFEASSCP